MIDFFLSVIGFFEHESLILSIFVLCRPEFKFTSQYLVKVDDFFLHYLQKVSAVGTCLIKKNSICLESCYLSWSFVLFPILQDSTTLELHQSFGTDFRTVAACQLKMRDILEKSSARLHSSVQLIGKLRNISAFSASNVIIYIF